ncbi:MAG TPA: agmatinase family protein [Candidatus Coprenecus stercoravium]|uniref:Agmatinase family protein n=1 Tax=Candidatus Coprenecus stercoravium TaxID=2840735 RepID=A0A9D2GQE3_9BACT|nr:agmatinase family protein [Candidatus Coprenecus stercoravium]
MAEFNPDNIGIANGNFFGFPCREQDADTVVVQVPWDATVSYGKGTAGGPEAMLEASLQVDLFDERIPGAAGMKVWTMPQDEDIAALNVQAREVAENVISALERGEDQESLSGLCAIVNSCSERLNAYVEETAERYLSQGKAVALVGGEHSVPLGLIKALSRRYPGMGVLHVDAHSDTREAYEGFRYSHASIMFNAMREADGLGHIAQVGIRDFCSAEYALVTSSEMFSPFTDLDIKEKLFRGASWDSVCEEIISTLPDDVYVSFDIDGLSPEYCPGTGTPVPGGLTFSQADWLLRKLASSGRRIVGFDLCEVAPSADSEWDANTGARMLFKLLLYSMYSRKKK